MNRPPDIASHIPLAATSGTGLMAAEHHTASAGAQLRTPRKTIGTNLGAPGERPPAEATSSGIRRTT
ncbi:hypothetical protein [Streptomyces longisporus]|uniref:Uncharacterized protein n=1 Tax=Streptomyces longisporus TaxID=1948 RepID=A0ABP5YBR0_STRLO